MYSEKLKELGVSLPKAPKPLAAYIPSKRVGDLIMTSGQLPMKDGELMYVGKLGMKFNEDDGKKAAELAIINALAVVSEQAGGIDNIDEVVKLTVFVNSAPDFGNQPEVANGASEFLVKVFGENGKHARSAVGVNVLPRDAAVELELIVKAKSK